MHWMILPFKRYADFEGRSRRMEYWMFQLFNILVVSVAAIPFFVEIAAMDPEAVDPSEGLGGFGIVSVGLLSIYVLVAFIPSIAVTVRRFHDRGLSGWVWLGLAVAGLIPLIGFITGIATFVITVLPGEEGSNQYGPDPKNPYDEDIFA